MKKIFAAGIVLGSLVLLCSASFAAGPIAKRQQNQQKRIDRGVKSGLITHREMHYLRHDQRKIRAAKHNALRDGYLSPAEKARIARMQNEASRHIHKAKTNNRHLPYSNSPWKPVRQPVKTHHSPVKVPCPPRPAVARSGGFLGVTVAQPGFSLA